MSRALTGVLEAESETCTFASCNPGGPFSPRSNFQSKCYRAGVCFVKELVPSGSKIDGFQPVELDFRIEFHGCKRIPDCTDPVGTIGIRGSVDPKSIDPRSPE